VEIKINDELGRPRTIRVIRSGEKFGLYDPVLNVYTHDFEFFDIDLQARKLPGTFIEATPPPPAWVEGAVSAHANAAAVAQFLKEVLMRNGLDNMGGKLISSIRCCSVFNGGQARVWHNAAWIGTQMVYGQRQVVDKNGKPEFHSFARSPEVVAHEITHGVTDRTARLQYLGLTGALNESYSDIFGILITNYAEPDRTKWNWTMGVAVSEGGMPLRDMAKPSRHGQPEKMSEYEDDVKNGRVPTNDNGGVHRYSGIHNKAFYNLAMARDPGDATKFLLGNRDLAALFDLALTQHLSPTSGFADSRRAVELVARTWFRGDADARDRALAAIATAFDDVGIVDEQQPAGGA
jgi:bacillolysin/neutral peptidase B